jgi:hypothetical protein
MFLNFKFFFTLLLHYTYFDRNGHYRVLLKTAALPPIKAISKCTSFMRQSVLVHLSYVIVTVLIFHIWSALSFLIIGWICTYLKCWVYLLKCRVQLIYFRSWLFYIGEMRYVCCYLVLSSCTVPNFGLRVSMYMSFICNLSLLFSNMWYPSNVFDFYFLCSHDAHILLYVSRTEYVFRISWISIIVLYISYENFGLFVLRILVGNLLLLYNYKLAFIWWQWY